MNYESLIWDIPTGCVPYMLVLFAIYMILDVLRSFILHQT